MMKSTWMVMVVTIVVLSLEIEGAGADTSNQTISSNADLSGNKTDHASLTNTSTSGNTKPTISSNTTGNKDQTNSSNTNPVNPASNSNPTGPHDPSPADANGTNANPGLLNQGSGAGAIPPNDKGTTTNTTSVQKSGVNIPSGNVLMLSAYVLLCLKIYFR